MDPWLLSRGLPPPWVGGRVREVCELPSLPFPPASERLAPTAPPLLAITLPDRGAPPGSSIPIPWAKWRGQHGEVLGTGVPDDCTSGGGVTETESCTLAVTGRELCSRGEGGSSSRPFLEPGGAAVDPTTSPVDEAWLARGDLLHVIRATGDHDGWTEEEVRRAQAKVTAASSRKKPPKWLHYLESHWVVRCRSLAVPCCRGLDAPVGEGPLACSGLAGSPCCPACWPWPRGAVWVPWFAHPPSSFGRAGRLEM